ARAHGRQLGGAGGRAARPLRPARRSRPGHSRVLARDGPADVRRARRVPRAGRAAARRTVRRRRPARGRGDDVGDRRGATARRGDRDLDPPAAARRRRLRRGDGAAPRQCGRGLAGRRDGRRCRSRPLSVTAAMNTTVAQLRALFGLRRRMVRSRRQRIGLLVLAVAVLGVILLAVAGGRLAPQQRFFNAAIVTPTAWLVYLGLCVLGPLAAGGGSELFP